MRTLITALAASVAACASTSAVVPAMAQAPATDSFTLPALPYAADALEPAIDAQTMTIHHDRHHQGYVGNLNRAVAADPKLAQLSLEQLVANASALSTNVRNNAGGHWNHSFLWKSMAPADQQRAVPSAEARLELETTAAFKVQSGPNDFCAHQFYVGRVNSLRFSSGQVSH